MLTSLDPLAVLVVDDCPDTAESMAALLHLLGYDAEAVNSGRAALDRMGVKSFDVVLLDLAMPGMTGCEVMRALAERSWRPFVVAVTGCSMGQARRDAVDAGFDLVLTKPVAPAVIDGILNRVAHFLQAQPSEPQIIGGP